MPNEISKPPTPLLPPLTQQGRTDAPAAVQPAPPQVSGGQVQAQTPPAGWTGGAQPQRPRVTAPQGQLPVLNPDATPLRPAQTAPTQTVPGGTLPVPGGTLPVPGGTQPQGPVGPTRLPNGKLLLAPLEGKVGVPLPTEPAPAVTDAALKNGVTLVPLTVGHSGAPVTALQYSLGRLGYTEGSGVADGKFGPRTAASLKAFQKDAGLEQTGVLDGKTLQALDAKLAATDLTPKAAKAADPLAYLSDFKALGMQPIKFDAPPPAASWSDPKIADAYGQFVGEYWDKLKENRVEADCKSINMLFMDKFREKVKQDTGIALPQPWNGKYTAPQTSWSTQTNAKPQDLFRRFEKLDAVRGGYDAAQQIQQLDPQASMLSGVNLRPGTFSANQVARATVPVQQWDPSFDNGGDSKRPEIPVQEMRAGDMIFIDHGKGTWDHAVNVVKVERGPDGKVTRAVLATGSFDDMKDSDGATAPRGLTEVNNYSEEVTVDFDAEGRVKSSKVTWSSEPEYLVGRRYSAVKLLMEQKPNGRAMLASWGARPGKKPEPPLPAPPVPVLAPFSDLPGELVVPVTPNVPRDPRNRG